MLIIEPRVFKDFYGYFFESFSQRGFDKPTNKSRAECNNLTKSSLAGGVRRSQ